jgi:DNA-binding SARP family transcriptional activator
MQATIAPAEAPRRRDPLGLLGLLLVLALGATALYGLGGPPHPPAALPDRDTVVRTLQGSYLPLEVMAYALITAAWAVWFWTAASVALRLLVSVAEVLTRGAGWVGSLRAASDRVTLPVVRRVVDRAAIALLVVHLVGRGVPSASAAPLAPAPALLVRPADAQQAPPPAAPRAGLGAGREAVDYTVQPGDTLWAIAERFYGTGFEYPRLVAANADREMPDGRRFTRAGVILPGWILTVPLPSAAVAAFDGQTYYTVGAGDSLRGIAARLLGDEARWPEVFEANRDVAALEDGRTLTNPDIIWPGLRLKVPLAAPPAPVAPAPVIPPPVAPPPAAIIPVAPQPTPVPPTPTPVPTVAPPAPTAVPAPAAKDEPAPAGATTPSAAVYAAGLGAAALAGGAALLARRRVRRSLSEPPVPAAPENGVVIREGFAEAEPARSFSHHLHGSGLEPAELAAEQALRYCAERGLDRVSVVTAWRGRSAIELTLAAGLLAQARLPALAGEFGTRLGGAGRGWLTPDRDVLLGVAGPKLVGPLAAPADPRSGTSRLLPLGVLPNRETLYANWGEFGHVLVAGLPGGGTEVILTSLLAALTSRRRPDALRVWTFADPRLLPAQLIELPHQRADFIDPTDTAGVSGVLAEVQADLVRRMRRVAENGAHPWEPAAEEPELLVVVGELSELEDDGTALELIGSHGAAFGVRLLATTACPEALSEAVLSQFATRLVLQTQDEDQSIRLLGQPEGADLGGGSLLIRIDGRRPIRARGFRVSPEHLDELVRLMRATYGGPAAEAAAAAAAMAPVAADGDDSSEPADESAAQLARGEAILLGSEGAASKGADPGGERVSGGAARELSEAPSAARRNGHSHAPMDEGQPSTLIRVSCFGAFGVSSGDRELSPESEGGTHYKAWELLAFLAAHPAGAVSKEKLLEALWPDIDPQRAAGRLSTTVVRLRGLLVQQVPGLSADVVRSERGGTCRLNTSMVVSDVHQFLAICRSAPQLPAEGARVALARARALYRGDLFSEPFYDWAHDRDDSGVSLQERYREENYRITKRLAEMHHEAGEVALAVPLYTSLLRAEPVLEDVARSLYRCYRELGDRRALMREHRRLKQALQEMFRSRGDSHEDPELYQPEPETVAVFEEVLADLSAKAARRP